MKKGTFYITIACDGMRSVEQVTGYIDEQWNLGYHKCSNGAGWNVTDLFTGLALGLPRKTRKECVEELTKSDWLIKLLEYRDGTNKQVNYQGIRNMFEYLKEQGKPIDIKTIKKECGV